MSGVGAVPNGVPALGRGRHPDPSHGVCLMELAAFLAGVPHSDAPSCTHPVLAAVARVVNDGVSDQARTRLSLLVPRLIGTTDVSRGVTAALVLAVCEPALAAATAMFRPKILRAVRRARRQQRGDPSQLCTDWQLRSAASAAAAATAAVAVLSGSSRDDTLEALLHDALDAYRPQLDEQPKATQPVSAARPA